MRYETQQSLNDIVVELEGMGFNVESINAEETPPAAQFVGEGTVELHVDVSATKTVDVE